MQRKRRILSVHLFMTYLIVVLHSGIAHCHALPHNTPSQNHSHDHASTHHVHVVEHDHTSILHFLEHLFEGISHMHTQADNPVLVVQKAPVKAVVLAKKPIAHPAIIVNNQGFEPDTPDHSVARGELNLLSSYLLFSPPQLRGPPSAV